jgi:proline iminopeptidase
MIDPQTFKTLKITNKMKHAFLVALGIIFLVTGCDELDPKEPGLLVPRTVDEDSSLPSIIVNNTQLHAESFGNPHDPMVVVLHGGPGNDYHYLVNCKQLADHDFYVVFYDQRGSGLSKRERKSNFSIQVMLDDLTGVIAHYRTSSQQKVILLGHSWGAMLATAYIDKYPGAVDGAILAEPGGFVWRDIMDYVERAEDFGILSETSSDATYIDQFITGKETDHAMADYKFGIAAALDASNDNPTGNEGHVPFWRLGAACSSALFEVGEREKPDWTRNLRAFTTKILFVYREHNEAYGYSYAQHVSAAYPNVQLERIDDAGHDMLTCHKGWNNFLPIALNYLNELK